MYKLLIVGASLAAVGLTLAVVGTVVSGENPNGYNTLDSYTVKDVTYASAGITQINLTSDNRKVVVQPTDNPEILIHYYESDKDPVTVSNSGGIVTIDNDIPWYNAFIWNFDWIHLQSVSTITISIPRSSTSLALDLASSNGDLVVSDIDSISSLDLSTSNGAISLTGVIIASSEMVDLDTSNGAITMTNISANGEINAKTSNGTITGSNILSFTKEVFYTSNGIVNVDGVSAPRISGHSSNGKVDINISGDFADYHITMSTSNGDYYLNGAKVTTNAYNTSAANSVDASSTNGNIFISFN